MTIIHLRTFHVAVRGDHGRTMIRQARRRWNDNLDLLDLEYCCLQWWAPNIYVVYIYMVSQKKTQLGISLHELIGIPLASMTPLQILSPAVLHKSQVGHKMMLLWPTTTYNRLYTTTYTIYTWWILPLFFPIKKKSFGDIHHFQTPTIISYEVGSVQKITVKIFPLMFCILYNIY